MKKGIFLILLLAAFSSAWAGKSRVVVESNTEKQNVSSHKVPPNGELQLSVLYTITSPFHRAVKKMADGNELFSIVAADNSADLISTQYITCRLHAKGYLIHIFPSHYFW